MLLAWRMSVCDRFWNVCKHKTNEEEFLMKSAKRVAALALSLAMCGTLFAGCGNNQNTPSSNNEGGASSHPGVLNVHIETNVQSMDPQEATDGTSFEVIANITDGLTQPDADGQPIAAIAESWETSDDQLTWTFHLRQDAKWSSTGNPVTANDFVYSWQRAVDPDIASEYSYMLSDIGQIVNAADIIAGTKDKSELGVEAPDDYTLVVHLNAPVAYFLSLMYFPTFYPIEQSFIESCGDTYATSPETLQSNGAFIMQTYEPSSTEFTLVKNEEYWDADRIQLTQINYQLVQDNQQALLSYQGGDLDVITISGDQVDQVSADPEFFTYNAGYLWYLTVNMQDVPELANLNLRLALANAIDRETMMTNVVKDGSQAAYFNVPDGLAVGPDGQDFRATAEDYSDVISYDPEKAQEYLEKAKEELGVNSFEFDMIVDDDAQPQQVATYLQEQIQSTLPDVKISITIEPKKQRVLDCQSGDFEIGLTRWGPDYADPMTYLGMWRTNNNNNYGHWSNAEYDALLDDATIGEASKDAQARWDALHAAEAIAVRDMVIIPLYEKSNACMSKGYVSGVEYHPVALNRVYKNAVVA